MNFFALAEAAYNAYRAHMLIGEASVPTWDELTVRQRYAWQEAVKEACDIQTRSVLA